MARDFTKDTANHLSLGTGAINAAISGASAVTVSSWVQIDSATSLAFENRILGGVINSASTGISLSVEASSGTRVIRAAARSQTADGVQGRDGGTALALSSWHHLAGVFNFAGGTITPYVNGTADNGGAATFGSSTYVPGTPSTGDAIGSFGSPPGTTNPQFDGRIAEVAIWTVALTAAEVRALAAGVSPLRIRRGALVRYWPLYGHGTDAPSIVSGTGTGTIAGSLPNAPHPPVSPPSGRMTAIPYAVPVKFKPVFVRPSPVLGSGVY